MVFIEKSRDGQVTPITDVEAQDVACGQNHVVSYIIDTAPRLVHWSIHRMQNIIYFFQSS
jgi:hypothetical protein